MLFKPNSAVFLSQPIKSCVLGKKTHSCWSNIASRALVSRQIRIVIRGHYHHPVLYFTMQATEKYSAATYVLQETRQMENIEELLDFFLVANDETRRNVTGLMKVSQHLT